MLPPIDVRRGAAAALCALAAACTSAPPAPPPAPFEGRAAHFAGTPLTGPLDREVDGASAPWLARLEIAYVAQRPAGASEALSALARHVLLPRSATPLAPRGELALGARRLGEPAADAQAGDPPLWRAAQVGALLDGSTLALGLAPTVLEEDAAEPPWVELELELARTPRGVELALELWGPLAPDGAAARAQERLILDAPPELGGAPLRLFLPAPRRSAPEAGLALELALAPWPAEAGADELAALERAAAELDAAARGARERALPLSADEGARVERAGALAALADEGLRRNSLLFLADALGAPLAAELALLADDALLSTCVAALHATWSAADEGEVATAAFAWSLEVAAWTTLLELAADLERALPGELDAALLRHAGAAGRHPDLLRECLAACSDRAALEARFAYENRCFLEDSDPSARLRAFDWLAARGATPSGYDPLAPRAERRAALAAAEAAQGEQERAP